jgi:uncharacterized membrane protein YgaE (UPF0421/DUF939 family)
MKTTYRFEKTLGPSATAAGIFLILVGIVTSFFYITALVLVILGAFTALTDSSTTIDPENKRMRFSNNIFGIIKIGPWVDIKPEMKASVINETRIYRTYSRSNQQTDIKRKDDYLYLCNKQGKPILPVKKMEPGESHEEAVNKVAKEFGIEGYIS